VSVYPRAQTVVASSNVTVQCLVTTDPDEMSSLQIHWKRAGRYLVMTQLCTHRCLITTYDATRNSTLLISDVTVADSGFYVCHAISRVDVADATASLLVKGFSRFLSLIRPPGTQKFKIPAPNLSPQSDLRPRVASPWALPHISSYV